MHQSLMERLTYEFRENRHKLGFSFVLFFTFSLIVLNAIGFVPEPIEETSVSSAPLVTRADAAGSSEVSTVGDVRPLRVVIESVDIDARVETPGSRDVAVLDSALLRGAVHYPGSGTLADTSNMFIFGHSSHLPVVNNQNFRAFNNLEKVKEGDVIRVESSDTVNVYRVVSVELVSADDALIELSGRTKMLTLSTCNSFGEPSDRYVVKAEFVKSYGLTRPTAYLDKS